MDSAAQQSAPMNLRVGGRLAEELTRIAERDHNSVSAVARRLIAEALQRAKQIEPEGGNRG